MRSGPANSLLDIAGLRVGHAQRVGGGYRTGTTVVLAPPGGMVAGVDVRGAAPGTRETELLDPRNLVERVHAVVLSGGSAYGLSAACGVMDRLADAGIGFPVAGGVVPIVPAAVIYDLGRGGRFRATPDAAFGAAAYDAALAGAFQGATDQEVPGDPHRDAHDEARRDVGGGPPLDAHDEARRDVGGDPRRDAHGAGSVGAGTGAMAGGLAGGIGSASVVLSSGATVAALAVVNAAGSVLDPGGGCLSGARYGLPGEFDHLREPSAGEVAAWRPAGFTSLNTTIGVVATDLTLTKAQCGKLAGVAHDGLARAIRPAHTMVDGDTVFAVATCARPAPWDPPGVYGAREGDATGLAAHDATGLATGLMAYLAPDGATGILAGRGTDGATGLTTGLVTDGAAGQIPAEPPGADLHELLAAGADVFSRAVAHAVLAATGREEAPAYLDVFPSASRGTS